MPRIHVEVAPEAIALLASLPTVSQGYGYAATPTQIWLRAHRCCSVDHPKDARLLTHTRSEPGVWFQIDLPTGGVGLPNEHRAQIEAPCNVTATDGRICGAVLCYDPDPGSTMLGCLDLWDSDLAQLNTVQASISRIS